MPNGMPLLPEGWVAVEKSKLRQLEREARLDFLTELYNKGAFERSVKRFLHKTDQKHALILVDIDNFKQVNDHYGHLGGDWVLRTLADTIQEIFGDSGFGGRIGGDEFTIFLQNMTGQADIKQRMDAFYALVKNRCYEKYEDLITISAGAASYPQDGGSYTALFAAADRALYRAKQLGKNCYTFADTE